MEATSFWIVGAVVSALLGGGCLGFSLVAVKERPRLRKSVGDIFGDGQGLSSVLRWRLRNGVKPILPLAKRLMAISWLRDCAQQAVWEFRVRGIETTPTPLASCVVATVGVLGVGALVISRSIFGFLATVVCLLVIAVLWCQSRAQKRRYALRLAIPDALRSMSVCFQSGLSLLQTFQHVSEETSEPLSTLFSHAAHRMEIGESVTDALATIREDSVVQEMAFISVALDAQHQSGGSLRHVLDSARSSIESELELKQKLHVQTAQAHLSARVVCVLPFVLLAVFSLISDGFLDPFFESLQGLIMLGVAFGMQIAGIVAVRKMLQVEELS